MILTVTEQRGNAITLTAPTGEQVFMGQNAQPVQFEKVSKLAVGATIDLQTRLNQKGNLVIVNDVAAMTDADFDALEKRARYAKIMSGMRQDNKKETLLDRQIAALAD